MPARFQIVLNRLEVFHSFAEERANRIDRSESDCFELDRAVFSPIIGLCIGMHIYAVSVWRRHGQDYSGGR